MNDIELWRRLAAYALQPDNPGALTGVAEQLHELSLRPLSERGPFLAFVRPLLGTDNSELRAAAVAVCAGCSGHTGVGILVAALDDSDEQVRRQAVLSLRDTAGGEPWRWAHAMFHPRTDVRLHAVSIDAPKQADYRVYLLPDPALRDALGQPPWPKGALPLAFDYYDRNTVDLNTLAEILGQESAAGTAATMGHSVRRLPEEVDALLDGLERGERPSSSTRDLIDVWCAVFRGATAKLRSGMLTVFAAALQSGPQALRARAALAIVLDGLTHGHDAELLPVATAMVPALLLSRALPLQLRRQAASGLGEYRKGMRTLPPLLVTRLLACKVALRPDGTPNLRVVATLLGFLGAHRVKGLLEGFDVQTLALAAIAQPECWRALCELVVDPREFSCLQQFADKVLAIAPHSHARITATGLPIWLRWLPAKNRDAAPATTKGTARRPAPSYLQALARLDSSMSVGVLVGLVQNAKTFGVVPKHNALERIVDDLERKVDAEHLPDLFEQLLLEPESQVEQELAGTIFNRVVVRRKTAVVVEAVLGFEVELQRIFIALNRKVLHFSRGCERAIAQGLEHHEDSVIANWAHELAESLQVKPKAVEPVPTNAELSSEEAEAIATHADLSSALKSALARPVSGLCDALTRRTFTEPNSSACAALLACLDPAPAVVQQLLRFEADTTEFWTAVHTTAVNAWNATRRTSWLGHAWLAAWESHAFALLGWIDKQPHTLLGVLTFADKVGHLTLRCALWSGLARAVVLRSYRQRGRLTGLITPGLVPFIVQQLDTDVGPHAAKILVVLHTHGLALRALETAQEAVTEMVPDMSSDTRHELARWVRVDGLQARAVAARPYQVEARAGLLEGLAHSTDLDELVRACAHINHSISAAAIDRLVKLGPSGQLQLRRVLLEQPADRAAKRIAVSVTSWSELQHVRGVRGLLDDPLVPAATRFELALSLVKQLGDDFVGPATCILLEPTTTPWLTPAGYTKLLTCSSIEQLSVQLAASPHPHAYQRAVKFLAEHKNPPVATAAALARFLACGPQRPGFLRRLAAHWLADRGDTCGDPILLAEAMDADGSGNRGEHDETWCAAQDSNTLTRYTPYLLDASLIGGQGVCRERRTLTCLRNAELPTRQRLSGYQRLLLECMGRDVRSEVAKLASDATRGAQRTDQVAEVFAWGIRRGRELTGRLFRIHMPAEREALGYTRLTQDSIYVSPMPLLRRDQHGRQIVEALVLHELGHHMYHRDPVAQSIWAKAQGEGLGGVLNLVADEHLERNLRAVDAAYGDRLKRLASYAFQHSKREMDVGRLLAMLRAGACEALGRAPLGVGFGHGHVVVESGSLLRALEASGDPFASFVRALRMGLGRRGDDPVLTEALDLFKHKFRQSNMQRLYEITVRLSQLYGSACELANGFGGHEGLGEGERERSVHGGDLSDDDVQHEVERILNPGKRTPGHDQGPAKLQINVSQDLAFPKLTMVEAVARDPDKHRAIARELRRYSQRVRGYFERLGLTMVPQGARLQGRAFDRSRVNAVVTRGDPRMLVARQLERRSDLFLGVLIDCSGSMSIGPSMSKAHRFGVLLAEATRGMRGVDTRFFGFTDSVLYNAGDAAGCAVASLEPGGGNNDAGALEYVANVAKASSRKAKLIVMVSDGLPTECSVESLRGVVNLLTRRWGILCAQVAVRHLEEVCFPHYIELTDDDLAQSVRRFGEIISDLARRALGG